MDKISSFICKRSKQIMAMVILLNLVALVSFVNFNFDTDFLSSFSKGNPKAEEFNALSEKYSSGEIISVLIEDEGEIVSQSSLQELYSISSKISMTSGVKTVEGILPPMLLVNGQTVPVDSVLISSNYLLLEDYIKNKSFFTEQFLSYDGKSTLLMVALEMDADAGTVIDSLEVIKEESTKFELSLAGNEVIQDTLWNYLLRILLILPPVAVILILSIFRLMLKNQRYAVFSMLPAAFAALWTFGAIFFTVKDLSIVTVICPLFIIIIGSAYGLHYVSHFIDNYSEYGNDKQKLVKETLKRVGTPIFLATITTMAGFASLMWTDVVPMQQMGLFVTLGIGFAGFLAIFFLPSLLYRIKPPVPKETARESRLTKAMVSAQRHKKPIVIVFVVLIIASASFIPGLSVESNQLMFFKENSDIRQTFDKVEQNFGSAVPLIGEINSPHPQSALFNYQFAEEVLSTERELEATSGIGSVVSIFDIVKGINKTVTGQDAYPQNPMAIQMLLSQMSTDEQKSWVSEDGFMMMVRPQDLSSDDIAGIEAFVKSNEHISTITGLPMLFSEMNDLIVKSQTQSLSLALVLVFLMLWITLRRITAALAGIVPIAITVLVIMGMLSATGFNLNILTATLSAIALGIGVDYSIHLLSSIYYYRGQGLDRPNAISSSLSTVSRPILTNALGLAIGYSALFFSPLFIHTQAAAVMWVAMVVSSMAALLLVPVFFSKKEKPKVK